MIVTVDILMALKVMRDITETEYQSFDVLSMLLCTVSFSGILLGLGNLGAADFISLQVGFPLLVGQQLWCSLAEDSCGWKRHFWSCGY